MSVQNALNAAIYSRMTGGTSLTNLLANGSAIFFLQAPDDFAGSEYVVWSYQGGGDENDTPSRSKNMVLNIRAISRTGPAKAGSIDAQIDALFHHNPLTVAGWTNFWIARETDFGPLVGNDDAGSKYWQSGALYRVRLDS